MPLFAVEKLKHGVVGPAEEPASPNRQVAEATKE
jgi:hypothetical protein